MAQGDAGKPRSGSRERIRAGAGTRIGVRRLLGWAAFLPLASRAPIYGRLFWELVLDERTPVGRKAMLAGRSATSCSAATSSRTTSR